MKVYKYTSIEKVIFVCSDDENEEIYKKAVKSIMQ